MEVIGYLTANKMKFSVLITSALSIFLYYDLAAQISISGTIKDEKSLEPLIGATVYISDLKTGSVADAKGTYKIENLQVGNHLMEVASAGYRTKVVQLTIQRDTILHIFMTESVAELNEVVVTAVTRATELRQSPVIIKAVDKYAIRQNTSSNLIDALKNIPGINQISTGTAISKPVIRGLGYNRVITLYNGIRQEGQQWGDEHGIEIDEFDIDRVEIVKGPGSMLYGSDGIAGVLHFLSPKPLQTGEKNIQWTSNYQSNNHLLANSLMYAGNNNGLQWRARFSNKFAGNYQNRYDGKVYNSGFREYNGSLFLGINKKWGHSHLNLSSFNAFLGLPEGERDSTGRFVFIDKIGQEQTATAAILSGYNIGFPNQSIQHNRLSSNTGISLPNGFLHVDLAVQQNYRREFADVMHPSSPELFFDLGTFHYNLRYNLNEFRQWAFSFGIGGMRQGNKNKGEEFIIPAYRFFDIGAFAFAQKKLNPNLTLSAAIRTDWRNLTGKELLLSRDGIPVQIADSSTIQKFAPINRHITGISGSAGAAWQLGNNSTLKINFSRGFRAPSIAELSANGRHEGTFRYEIGNSQLLPEVSHQIDLGYLHNSEHFVFELTPFANFLSNYIYPEKMTDKSGATVFPDPDDPAPGFRFVAVNARMLGAEIFTDFHPHPLDWLHIENAFSFVTARQYGQPDSSRYLPFTPGPKYSGVLRAQMKAAGKHLNNIYLRFGVDHYFAQNRVFSAYGTETATGSYTLLGAGLGANISRAGKAEFISIVLNAENLTNSTYQNHLSRLKYAPLNALTGRMGIFNMGRNISLKVIVNF